MIIASEFLHKVKGDIEHGLSWRMWYTENVEHKWTDWGGIFTVIYGIGLIGCFHVLHVSFAACEMKVMVFLFFIKHVEIYSKDIQDLGLYIYIYVYILLLLVFHLLIVLHVSGIDAELICVLYSCYQLGRLEVKHCCPEFTNHVF